MHYIIKLNDGLIISSLPVYTLFTLITYFFCVSASQTRKGFPTLVSGQRPKLQADETKPAVQKHPQVKGE